MDIQPILDKVLAAGLYSIDRQRFMCHALGAAWRLGLIGADERSAATSEIEAYIHSINPETKCLANCFTARGRLRRGNWELSPACSGDFVSGLGLAIFKDWANRPMP